MYYYYIVNAKHEQAKNSLIGFFPRHLNVGGDTESSKKNLKKCIGTHLTCSYIYERSTVNRVHLQDIDDSKIVILFTFFSTPKVRITINGILRVGCITHIHHPSRDVFMLLFIWSKITSCII